MLMKRRYMISQESICTANSVRMPKWQFTPIVGAPRWLVMTTRRGTTNIALAVPAMAPFQINCSRSCELDLHDLRAIRSRTQPAPAKRPVGSIGHL